MKIALFGYGKMGQLIEEIALQRGHEITQRITSQNRSSITAADFASTDAVIEFSTPDAALENIYFCLDAKVPVVVGTTGWLDQLSEVKNRCHQTDGALLYASNFSVGVNIFFALNRKLAEWMNDFPEYNVSVEEIHHVHKKDAPSGTAISLAEDLLNNLDAKKSWQKHETGKAKPEGESVLPIGYSRTDEVPGTHAVLYESEIDRITITHEAFNRKGFALGAVLAAEFLHNKKGVFTARDLFHFAD